MRTSIVLLIICCFFLNPITVSATDLRGRIDGIDTYTSTPFPLVKARVELRQKADTPIVNTYHTGRDGMYYFRNIQPGKYVLIVNNHLTVPVQVRATSLQDIGPILYHY